MNKIKKIMAFSLVLIAAPIFGGVNTSVFAAKTGLQKYLDLPLLNRDASYGPGGVNPVLPTDKKILSTLLNQARAQKVSPKRYAALLDQFWLVSATDRAGINLKAWNPRLGTTANRENLSKSYRLYEDLQLQHKELEWAGMAGLVGADFGGGLLDFELFTNIFDATHIQGAANTVVQTAVNVAGPGVINQLPKGVRALATFGGKISPEDLKYVLGMILVMQKNIFSDLMPMHVAYVTGGIKPITEMYQAGLIPNKILTAWKDVASKNPDRMAKGNSVLLMREQHDRIAKQWNQVKNYKGDIGQALTYATTLIGSPSLAGVIPMREYKPIKIDLGAQYLTTPLPSWNWADFPGRWSYINAELLPKYKLAVKNDWSGLVSVLSENSDKAMESKRLINNIPQYLLSMASEIKLENK